MSCAAAPSATCCRPLLTRGRLIVLHGCALDRHQRIDGHALRVRRQRGQLRGGRQAAAPASAALPMPPACCMAAASARTTHAHRPPPPPPPPPHTRWPHPHLVKQPHAVQLALPQADDAPRADRDARLPHILQRGQPVLILAAGGHLAVVLCRGGREGAAGRVRAGPSEGLSGRGSPCCAPSLAQQAAGLPVARDHPLPFRPPPQPQRGASPTTPPHPPGLVSRLWL